jgi:hypothetical protein
MPQGKLAVQAFEVILQNVGIVRSERERLNVELNDCSKQLETADDEEDLTLAISIGKQILEKRERLKLLDQKLTGLAAQLGKQRVTTARLNLPPDTEARLSAVAVEIDDGIKAERNKNEASIKLTKDYFTRAKDVMDRLKLKPSAKSNTNVAELR